MIIVTCEPMNSRIAMSVDCYNPVSAFLQITTFINNKVCSNVFENVMKVCKITF